ncbi:MAG: PepSY-associated TM helix domain-containing protein [Sphingomonas taxi]
MTRTDSAPVSAAARKPKRKWRGWWLKQLHTWHWMSAAVALVGMLLFATTGITLNHATAITATPTTVDRAGTLPPPLVRELKAPAATDAPLPPRVAAAVREAVGLDPAHRPGEWSDADVYVAMPRPGGDAWVSIDRTSGAITSEVTSRGWIAWANDLHKGRNTGAAWSWFLDVFAAACILFTLTGLLLLQLHARHRRATWPIVAAGVVIPLGLILVFIH